MTQKITCPQCGEKKTTVSRYAVTAPDGTHLLWAYYFACCSEPLAAWGYSDEWGEEVLHDSRA